jgi:hypothetical protein
LRDSLKVMRCWRLCGKGRSQQTILFNWLVNHYFKTDQLNAWSCNPVTTPNNSEPTTATLSQLKEATPMWKQLNPNSVTTARPLLVYHGSENRDNLINFLPAIYAERTQMKLFPFQIQLKSGIGHFWCEFYDSMNDTKMLFEIRWIPGSGKWKMFFQVS